MTIVQATSELLTRHEYDHEDDAECRWCSTSFCREVDMDTVGADLTVPSNVRSLLAIRAKAGWRIVYCSKCGRYSALYPVPRCALCKDRLTRRRIAVGSAIYCVTCWKVVMASFIPVRTKSTYLEEGREEKCIFCQATITPHYSTTKGFCCEPCLKSSSSKFVIIEDELSHYTGD